MIDGEYMKQLVNDNVRRAVGPLCEQIEELKDRLRKEEEFNKARRQLQLDRASMGERLRLKGAEWRGNRWMPVLLVQVARLNGSWLAVSADSWGAVRREIAECLQACEPDEFAVTILGDCMTEAEFNQLPEHGGW